jgi:hypothetical protein
LRFLVMAVKVMLREWAQEHGLHSAALLRAARLLGAKVVVTATY